MRWLNGPVWQLRPFAEGWDDIPPDAVVWISIAAFDIAWRLSDDYIGHAGAGSLHGDRYTKVGEWISGAKVVDVPVVYLDEDGAPSFTDGRHSENSMHRITRCI
jgi:hypothetical protein